MLKSSLGDSLKRCWSACWHRARRPVEGVLISENDAATIAERALRNAALDFDTFPSEPKFAAHALETTAQMSRLWLAERRHISANPELHRDPTDRRYERNLHLERLQKQHPEHGFDDLEWNHLPPLLRPLALAALTRKGIRGADADEVFNDTLAELVRERESAGQFPILDLKIFEEIIPLHARIVSCRAIDWYRRRNALKNLPNRGDSIDAMSGNPEHSIQFEDVAADPERCTFERIYKGCKEALTADEWEMIYMLFVAQSATIQDLIGDDAFCERVGIKRTSSGSTRRRELSGRVEHALEKIRNTLIS